MGRVSTTIRRDGTLHGIGGWFQAQLSSHVMMTNSPLAASRINRPNVFYPVERSVAIRRDDCVDIAFDVIPQHSFVNWAVEVRRAGQSVERFAQSTLRGMLISKQYLHRTRPEFVPLLTPWGMARRSVLDLCSGERPLSEIEQQVYECHRDLFRSAGEAQAFVVEVLSICAKD